MEGDEERSADGLIGRTVADRYEVLSELGRGGMGAVYRAVHIGSSRRVALKIIHKKRRDPTLRARFQREARAAGRIESRHVAQVLDVGIDEKLDLPFIAMEFLEGEDLSSLIERLAPLPSQLVCKIAYQVMAGLVKAHALGIVHRDLKPGNIFLAHQDDEVVLKLLDFGVAKLIDTKTDGQIERLTSTGALLGSPLYMSPEQALGSVEVNELSDVWSLGVVLFEALVGKSPFHHCSAVGELLVTICSERPPPVIQKAPWVDPRLSELIERMLVTAPEERMQPTTALSAALALLPNGTSLRAVDLVAEPLATSQVPSIRATLLSQTRPAKVPKVPASEPPPGPDARRTTGAVISDAAGAVTGATTRQRLSWMAPAGVAAVLFGGGMAYSFGFQGERGVPKTATATNPSETSDQPSASVSSEAVAPVPAASGSDAPPAATSGTASAASSSSVATAPGASGRVVPSSPTITPGPATASARKNYGF